MSQHVDSKASYFGVFGALMVLTVLTVLATKIELGALNIFVALGIAVLKACLVIWFFMHVRHATRLTKLIVGGSVLWLVFLFLFIFADYVTRGWLGPLGK